MDLIHPQSPPLITHLTYSGLAGSPRVAIDLAANTPATEFRSAVVFFGQPPPRPEYLEELKAAGIPWQHVAKRGRWDWLCHGRAAAALLATQPAVIVIHGLRNLPIACWLRLRTIPARLCLVQHGPVQELQRPFWRLASRLACKLADSIVSVSPEVHAEVQRHAGNNPRHQARLHLIPNGIPVAQYHDASASVLTGRQPVPHLLMAAVLSPQKDHHTLLQACALLHDRGLPFHLDILGDGPLRAGLGQLCASLKLTDRVTFHGAVPARQLAAQLATSDLYVHATHSEGLSISMLQAMATGLPVVASDVPGMAAFKQSEAAITWVPENAATALATALADLLQNPAHARLQGQRNRATAAAHFDIARTAQLYTKAWSQLFAPEPDTKDLKK